jgi:hypothetical protein
MCVFVALACISLARLARVGPLIVFVFGPTGSGNNRAKRGITPRVPNYLIVFLGGGTGTGNIRAKRGITPRVPN